MVEDAHSRDQDLHRRFAAMRRLEEGQAPGFALPVTKPGAHRGRRSAARMVALVGGVGMVVAAVAFLLRIVPTKPGREPGHVAGSITQWRAPTDFLLETPGREFLRNVPAIGVSPNHAGARGAGHEKRK